MNLRQRGHEGSLDDMFIEQILKHRRCLQTRCLDKEIACRRLRQNNLTIYGDLTMEQNHSQISLQIENLQFTIPIPPEYIRRFRSVSAQEASEQIQPVAMFIIAGLAHQLKAEKEPPSGYQMFKSIYCAREAGIGIPFSALESKAGMSKFIANCVKQKRGTSQNELTDTKAEGELTLQCTLARNPSPPNDFFRRVRDLISLVTFKKSQEKT